MNFNFTDNKYAELSAQLRTLSGQAMYGRDDKADRFQKSYLYLACLAPKKIGNEISSYVEPVVRRALEAVKPSLMNIFTENEKRAVQFRPLTRSSLPIDMVASGAGINIASLIDDYINKVFINENGCYDLLDRALTEALVTGDVFLKYFVEEERIEEKFNLEKAPEDTLSAILAEYKDTDMEKVEASLKRRQGLISGSFKALRIEKNIKIEFVPFADIYVTGQYEDIRDARYICQRMSKTVGEMMEMGFPFEKLETASTFRSNSSSGDLSTQKLVNFGTFGDDDFDASASMDPLERSIHVYEHYLYSSQVDKKVKKVKLYRVLSTDIEILDVEEATHIPFVHGCMERIPGSFWGVSLYDKFAPSQDMLSHLMRSVEYNAAAQTYGRYVAVEGMYNRESLLNNRPGSVIEVKKEFGPQAISWFPDKPLPPTVEGLIAKITDSYRSDITSSVGIDVTGSNISATAAAITANSADMKDKVIARTLAYTLFRPLFEGIYNIIVSENLHIGEIPNPQVQQAQAQVERGELPPEVMAEIPQVLPVSGADLPSVSDFIIDVNTANDEAILNGQLINLLTMFAQMPQGLVDNAEIAAQLTGLSKEEVAKFFPAPPEPTPEQQQMQQMAEQIQMETAQLNNELMKGQVGKVAAETIKIEEELKIKIDKAAEEALRAEEESLQQFKILELKEKELNAELSGQEIKVSEYKR